MAIFDAMFEFSTVSTGQDLGNLTDTEVLAATNVINFTQANLEMGAGEPLWVNVRMGVEALLSSGSATMKVSLMAETDGTIDTDSTTLWATGDIPKSDCGAGAWLMRMPLPYNVDRGGYLGLLYTIGAATLSAGTVSAWIDHGPQSSHDTQVSASNI